MAIGKQSRKINVKPVTRRNTKVVTGKNKSGNTIIITHVKNGESGDVELIDLDVSQNGTFYAPAGQAFKSVKVEIKEYVAPGVTVTLTPSATLLDKDVDTIGELTVTASIKKGTNEINNVVFFLDGTKVKEVTDNVKDGGVFIYTHTFNPRTNTTFKVQVIAYDKQNKTGQITKEVRFVNKTYYGTVASTVVNPTPDEIVVLSNALTGTKAYVYSGINMDYGKVVYAYPASFGSLTSIKDTKNNINYTDSFTKTTVNINNTAYFVYTLTDPSAADDVQLTFA